MSKILDYAKGIRLEILEEVAKITSENPENEWCDVMPSFPAELHKLPIFATRLIPFHNHNGFCGSKHQFLWRSDMDYYNLSNEAETAKEEIKGSYAEQLARTTTLPDLYAFREMLKVHLSEYKEQCREEAYKPGSKKGGAMPGVEFFIRRIEAQIKHLESQGIFLAAVGGSVSGTLELTSDPIPGVLELSPIEKKAESLGLYSNLKMLQRFVNEGSWAYSSLVAFRDLYYSGLVVRLSIYQKQYAYLWRHDMEYESFFQVKKPE